MKWDGAPVRGPFVQIQSETNGRRRQAVQIPARLSFASTALLSLPARSAAFLRLRWTFFRSFSFSFAARLVFLRCFCRRRCRLRMSACSCRLTNQSIWTQRRAKRHCGPVDDSDEHTNEPVYTNIHFGTRTDSFACLAAAFAHSYFTFNTSVLPSRRYHGNQRVDRSTMVEMKARTMCSSILQSHIDARLQRFSSEFSSDLDEKQI